MAAANDRIYDTDLPDVPSTRVMVGDGVMGTQLQAAHVIVTIQRNSIEAGADAVETKYVRLQSR